MRLNKKLFIIIAEISIIPLLVGGYIAYFNIKQTIISNISNNLASIAQIQKNRLLENIDDRTDLLELFSSKVELSESLEKFNNNPTQEIQKEINDNIIATNIATDIIKQIMIVGPSGTIIASTQPILIGKNISGEDFFKQGIKQNDVSFIIKDIVTGQVSRYLVGPIVLDGKTLGMAVLTTDTSGIDSLADDYTGLGATGETLFVKNDGNGNAVFLNQTRFDKNSALNLVIPKNKTNVPAIAAINGEETVLTNDVDYRGVSVFAVTRYIPSIGWGIVVKIDKSEALLPLSKSEELFLFILFTIIILIIVIALSVSTSLTDSILSLVSTAKKVTEGDLSVNFQVNTKDEIGDLALFLNQMLLSLKKATENYKNLNENLETEVRVKTSQMESQNKFLNDANQAMLNLSEDLEKEKESLKLISTNQEAILNSIGDGLLVVDKSGKIQTINPAAEKMMGYSSQEVIGKLVFDIVPMEDDKGEAIPKEKRPFIKSLWERRVVIAICNLVRRNKTKFIASVISSPITLNDSVIGVVDVVRDITKERAIDKAKTEFVSLASHQLRTPATAIKWYSEMLMDKKSGKLNKKQSGYLDAVYHGNERLIKLVDNLLSVSRIELGKIVPKIELVDIKKMLNSVLHEQKSEIVKRKHKLIIEQPKENLIISTDMILCRMIFQNFISNAIKYTLNKGKIICTIKKEGENMLFSVADNGVGIPKAEQPRIFEKLFRASTSLALDKEGNGLGMYIVKQVAGDLGGKVWFESEEGKGSTFYCELPMSHKAQA